MYNFDISKLKTIEDYEKAHKEYWTFIAENHLSEKPFIPYLYASCFACHFSLCVYDDSLICKNCPIADRYCKNEGSLYEQWRRTDSQDEKDRIALEISEAKFKKKGRFRKWIETLLKE